MTTDPTELREFLRELSSWCEQLRTLQQQNSIDLPSRLWERINATDDKAAELHDKCTEAIDGEGA